MHPACAWHLWFGEGDAPSQTAWHVPLVTLVARQEALSPDWLALWPQLLPGGPSHHGSSLSHSGNYSLPMLLPAPLAPFNLLTSLP